jgi:rhodanese-related sulfurtransferase
MESDQTQRPTSVTGRSLEPKEVWALLERGEGRLLDLRTNIERRRYGAPPGAQPVSLARHVLNPEGDGTIYPCQHAVRSKAMLRGAAEVAGGFVAWRHAGLPIEKVSSSSQFRQQVMEPLWSPVVATGGSRSQVARGENRRNQAKTVAVGCDQLPRRAPGQEGVDLRSRLTAARVLGSIARSVPT